MKLFFIINVNMQLKHGTSHAANMQIGNVDHISKLQHDTLFVQTHPH